MRIKLQALTEHIHGFLLILGITAFLSCLIFPSHYLFYFFHSFLLLIPFYLASFLVFYLVFVFSLYFCHYDIVLYPLHTYTIYGAICHYITLGFKIKEGIFFKYYIFPANADI